MAPKKAKLPPADILYDEYIYVRNMSELARKYGVTQGAVQAKFRRAGLISFGWPETVNKKSVLPPIDEVLDLRREGKTLKQIGDMFGVTKENVSVYIKKRRKFNGKV